MTSLEVPKETFLVAAVQDKSLGGERFELQRVTLSSERSLERWGSFRGDVWKGFWVEGTIAAKAQR